MNFFELLKKFPTEESVINHFIITRYGSAIPSCPICHQAIKIVPEESRPKFFHCNICNKSFSVFTNTIFEKSSTDLRKWMYAFHLFLNGKKGISGYQFKREIDVTYKTAWRMLKQIRIAMGNTENPEIDETYIQADNEVNARRMLEMQYGSGCIVSGPSEVR